MEGNRLKKPIRFTHRRLGRNVRGMSGRGWAERQRGQPGPPRRDGYESGVFPTVGGRPAVCFIGRTKENGLEPRSATLRMERGVGGHIFRHDPAGPRQQKVGAPGELHQKVYRCASVFDKRGRAGPVATQLARSAALRSNVSTVRRSRATDTRNHLVKRFGS